MKSRFQALKLIRQVGIELLTAEQALENQQEPEVESLTRAEKKASEALRLCRQHKISEELIALGQLATIYRLQKKYRQALALFRDQLVLAEQRKDIDSQQSILEMLGRISLDLEEWMDARDWYKRALELFELRRGRLAAEAIQVSFNQRGVALYEPLIQIALLQNEKETALEIVEQSKSRALLNLLGTMPLDCPSKQPSLVVREKDLLAAEREVAASWRNTSEQAVTERIEIWQRWLQLRRELEQVWQEMAQEGECADYIALRCGKSPDLAAVRNALVQSGNNAATKVALLTYFVGKETTWLVVIKPHEPEPLAFDLGVEPAHLHRCALRLLIDFNGLKHESILWGIGDETKEALALSPDISKKPRLRLEDPAGAGPHRFLLKPEYYYQMTYLDKLSEVLLPSQLGKLLSDCNLLCVSAHGPLHGLPFHALRWHDGRYLIENFGVSYVPSVGVLRYCQRHHRARQGKTPRSCLFAGIDAVGNQPFEQDGQYLAPLFTEVHKGQQYLALEGSEGPRAATKQQVSAEMEHFDVVHLACHGLFATDRGEKNPLESGLQLAASPLKLVHQSGLTSEDSLLTAREVFKQSLCADLVTLRACSSGRKYVEAGDELMGLSRAFLYAGANSLLVSLWNVNSQSSHKLLATFYQRWLKENMPKWKALQQAQCDFLNSDDNHCHHPYHWAPFILIGNWA